MSLELLVAPSPAIDLSVQAFKGGKDKVTASILPHNHTIPYDFVLRYFEAIGKVGHSNFTEKDISTQL